MQSEYEEKIKVCQYECDICGRMKAGYLLRHAQQLSTNHCNLLGMDSLFYQRTGTAFLLSEISLTMNRSIFAEENLRLITTSFPPKRAVYLRSTHFYDTTKHLVAYMYSRWILVDMTHRRILRKPPEDFVFPFSTLLPPQEEKMVELKHLDYISLIKGTYSGSDANHHLNNAEYSDFIFDCLPLDVLVECRLQRMRIKYHREILLGEEVEVFMGYDWERKMYVFLGKKDKKKYFEANLEFCVEG